MDYEDIKHNAERETRKWKSIYYFIMLLLFILIAIWGASFMDNSDNTSQLWGVQLIATAIVGAVSVKLLCSLIDTITNISVKLDKLEKMERTLKKIESNQNRLTHHLDK